LTHGSIRLPLKPYDSGRPARRTTRHVISNERTAVPEKLHAHWISRVAWCSALFCRAITAMFFRYLELISSNWFTYQIIFVLFY